MFTSVRLLLIALMDSIVILMVFAKYPATATTIAQTICHVAMRGVIAMCVIFEVALEKIAIEMRNASVEYVESQLGPVHTVMIQLQVESAS